ncbi:type VII secretion protein EssC [Aciduricibacillus chroicocephali]|uniref:Type VII secretion protein EssC n=1 Tax=Aciduricibacillus chroicocephali TaxID=3054939 RepID=A0ABY9KU76_9BACI|nr:type VII secretion protein EssC [Bacillaceae bacterium 44XB]
MADPLLMISCDEELHKCRLPKGEEKRFTIGSQRTDTVRTLDMTERLEGSWDGMSLHIADTDIPTGQSRRLSIGEKTVQLHVLEQVTEMEYDTSAGTSLSFGTAEYHDIVLKDSDADFLLQPIPDGYEVEVFAGELYHNYARVHGQAKLAAGDHLFFDGILIVARKDKIEIQSAPDQFTAKRPELIGLGSPYRNEYPDYHRSPRIIHREPVEKKIIAKPSNKPSKPSEQLARTIVPPLVMIAALVIISIFQPRGIYIIAMLSVTIVTIIFSVTSYIKSVKQYRIDTKEREESYKAYLLDKAAELHHAREEQRHALLFHYPDASKIRHMAKSVDARIYEKAMHHHDFLNIRAGLGTEPTSFEIDFNEEEFTQDKDELVLAARKLRNEFSELEQVPIVTSLMKGPVGYIGKRSLVVEQLQQLAMQIALFHSYHDVRFISVFPEEEKREWEWMRWLPHASLPGVNVRGFVYHERSRDQVLSSLYQVLKERKLVLDEKQNKNEKTYFTPHFVVFLTDEKIMLDHSIMEFFNEDPQELGVSLVFVQDVLESLPEHVTTVVDIRDAQTGNILLEEGELVNRRFDLDHFPGGFNKEDVSRALAPLNHLQSLKNSIPEAVTFLEMYGAEQVEELQIAERWQQNETYKSLAVPLGMRGKDDIVQLNLHEKAHGPHGLVAGTTGSGKSEIIQSYILSLAVNFHPYEVGFLLIDYKGGGMANLFKNLPHLMGTITNLDGAQSMRALASIKAELQKRQRLFGEHDVNHINQYQKLYKEGKAEEAMPHLFLISDEFAELKAEQPDFMKELVSTARIGRSLGIHLILATQKPSGVVDDQIWSNSKFKLALKVQNASDSNEILKTPDAAEITLPGRAYLQVGNNEIYELFQSAWSGADYVKDKDDSSYLDTTIYAINDLGQYDILTEDLSGLDRQEKVQKTETELEAVIGHIHDFAEERKIERLPRPWLPPLEREIFLSNLSPVDYKSLWHVKKQPLIATIGMVDIPEMQKQEPLDINLTKDGHMVIIASPGYGKSTMLQTIAMDLARKHSPEKLHLYLLDLGTNGLLPLRNLPHTADAIRVDEEAKMEKLFRRLSKELKERKQKLSDYGVASMEMYERASGEEVPHIIVMIDTFDSAADTSYKESFDAIAVQIAREGASVGMHLVITAGRQNAMRAQLLANIKTQISLYQIDDTEVRSVVGRTALPIDEIPGRGLIKLDDPVSFQTALPASGSDTLEIVEAIKAEAEEMAHSWTGSTPRPIPMVPEKITFKELLGKDQTAAILKDGGIPFAVDFEEVEPVELDYRNDQNLLVIGEDAEIIENAFMTILETKMHNDQIDIALMDNATSGFASRKEKADLYANDGATLEEMLERLQALFEAREDAFREVQSNTDGRATLADFMKGIRPLLIILTDAGFTIESLSMTAQEKLAKLIDAGSRMGMHFVIGAMNGAIDRNYDEVANAIKKFKSGIIIGRIADQNMLDVLQPPYKEKSLQRYEAYYVKRGKYEKIKIATPY